MVIMGAPGLKGLEPVPSTATARNLELPLRANCESERFLSSGFPWARNFFPPELKRSAPHSMASEPSHAERVWTEAPH